jgi:hypothetical protein
MLKPMKVKVFMDATASAIEAQINDWLDGVGPDAIIKSETVVTAIAEKPCIVVTVWYEPPEAE